MSSENLAMTPWIGRAILHVDMDAFFAAVEQLDHPEWRGLPVVVGGSPEGRGVIAAASYEARACGVRSAMPSARAAALCPDLIWAPARFERYRELSDAVFDILRDESALVQPVSIDEAYLDVTPGSVTAEDPVAIAMRIQQRVEDLGLSCSIGVAATKTVAKVASDHDKPHGLTVVPPGSEAAFLAPLPLRALPGIGPRTAERLEGFGLRTLGELAALDDRTLTDVVGSGGPALARRARGIDERQVHGPRPVKSISSERTFGTDVNDDAAVDSILADLAARTARRARRKGLAGRTITVKVRFSDFTTRSAQRTLPQPTAEDDDVSRVARELVREVRRSGVGVRLLGVGLAGFTESAEQLAIDLVSEAGSEGAVRERRARLTSGIDAVRERFGDDAVRFGRQKRRGD